MKTKTTYPFAVKIREYKDRLTMAIILRAMNHLYKNRGQ